MQAFTANQIETTGINPVHRQYRQPCRKRPGVVTVSCFENFTNIQIMGEVPFCAARPVIEITSDHQWRIMRYMRVDSADQPGKLLLPLHAEQTQVYADHVDMVAGFRELNRPMQQTSAGRLHQGNINVFPFDDRVLTQYCIAMVA